MANLTDENNKYSKAAILICATKETGIILNITMLVFWAPNRSNNGTL
jgi:hypothetical protein